MKYSIPKKLVVIEDICGIGRCSLSVSIPIISACGVQACPIPTSVFSNHTGFEHYYKADSAFSLPDFFQPWLLEQFQVDGIYCGYLGTISYMQAILSFASTNKHLPIYIDPVMGDHGKIYKALPKNYLEAMKTFIINADIITPNLTEACLLADIAYQTTITKDFLFSLTNQLIRKYHIKSIVITGITTPSHIGNFIYDNEKKSYELLEVPLLHKSRPGTGDIFASIVFANSVKGVPLLESVKKASDFIYKCTKASDEAFVAVEEGVIFEPILPELYS